VSSLRTFVAIEISDRLKKNLKAHCKGIQASNPLVHWVPEGNLHLTLCFLGDVDLNQFHQVAKIVQESCSQIDPFELVIGGLGGFPNRQNPRIIWAGVESEAEWTRGQAASENSKKKEDRPALFQLNQALVQNFLFHRFNPDNKPFRPHVTLGRLPGQKHERQFQWDDKGDHPGENGPPVIGRQFVQEVKVMTSEASGPSVTYSVVATVGL